MSRRWEKLCIPISLDGLTAARCDRASISFKRRGDERNAAVADLALESFRMLWHRRKELNAPIKVFGLAMVSHHSNL